MKTRVKIFIAWSLVFFSSCRTVDKSFMRESQKADLEAFQKIENLETAQESFKAVSESLIEAKVSEVTKRQIQRIEATLRESMNTSNNESTTVVERIVEKVEGGKVVNATRTVERQAKTNASKVKNLEVSSRKNYETMFEKFDQSFRQHENELAKIDYELSKKQKYLDSISHEVKSIKESKKKDVRKVNLSFTLMLVLIGIFAIYILTKRFL